MKLNYKMYQVPFIIFLIACCFSLSSCNNFLQGNSFKEQMEKDIDYANSPRYVLYVSADEGTGTVTSSGGGMSFLKPTESLLIDFQPVAEYKFIKWIAVDKNNQTISRENYIEFSDPDSKSTQITLLYGCDDILIKPYCLPYLKVQGFYPEYKDNGVSFNSTIKISFSNYIDKSAFSYSESEIKFLNLSEEKLLKTKAFDGSDYVYGYTENGNIYYKNIEISTPAGIVTHYFNAPVIVGGNVVCLELKKEYYDLFSSDILENSVKDITVSISNTITDIKGMGFSDNYSNLLFKYAVNNQIIAETPVTNVLFSSEEDWGSVNPKGLTEIYTDLSYTLNFTPSEDYYFEKWGVFYASNGKELPYGDKILQIEDIDQLKTSFTLTMPLSGIMVRPICKIRPKVLLITPNSIKVAAHSDIAVTFSNIMNPEDLRWKRADIENEAVQKELRDSNNEIYGYISLSGEHKWCNITINSSTGENLLSYFKFAELSSDGKTIKITADTSKELPSGTIIFVKINKSIRDIYGIPCGSKLDYIEFNYQVE